MIVHLHINMLRLDLKSKQIRTYSSETNSRILSKVHSPTFVCHSWASQGSWASGAVGHVVLRSQSHLALLPSPHPLVRHMQFMDSMWVQILGHIDVWTTAMSSWVDKGQCVVVWFFFDSGMLFQSSFRLNPFLVLLGDPGEALVPEQIFSGWEIRIPGCSSTSAFQRRGLRLGMLHVHLASIGKNKYNNKMHIYFEMRLGLINWFFWLAGSFASAALWRAIRSSAKSSPYSFTIADRGKNW